MMEFIKHALGLCGESHPNLWTIILGTPTLGLIIYSKNLCVEFLDILATKRLKIQF